MPLNIQYRFPEFHKEMWKLHKLSDIATYENGKAHEQDIDSQGEYIVVNSKFISTDGKIVKHSNLANCLAKEGDILMVLSDLPNGRALAKCYLVKEENKFTVNQRICKISPGNKIKSELLFYLLNRNPYFMSFDDGVKQTNLKSSDVLNFELLIPLNPKEQQKISDCLSSLDEVIELNEEKITALEDHKRGLMQNLFPQNGETVPKCRFPEFKNEGDWVVKVFEELFKIGNGRDYKHLKEGAIPVYGSGGYMLSVDDYLYDGESACIGRKGTIDKPIFLKGKFWTVDTLFYTYDFVDCLPKFIFYLFQTIDWKNHNEAGGIPSLSKANIYKIVSVVPKKIDEQQMIIDCLSSVDELIKQQLNKVEELKQHKAGLMQGMFPKI